MQLPVVKEQTPNCESELDYLVTKHEVTTQRNGRKPGTSSIRVFAWIDEIGMESEQNELPERIAVPILRIELNVEVLVLKAGLHSRDSIDVCTVSASI